MFPEGSPLRADPERIDQVVYAKVSLTGWRVFVFLMAVFLLCYASVLVTPYAFSDDYSFLVETLRGETGATIPIVGGRPTYAFLRSLFFPNTGNIGDLCYIRLLGVIGIALLAYNFYRTLVLVGWNCYQSIFLSMIVFTMPPFQVYASWATTAFHPFAALASGGAFSLAEQAFNERRLLHKWGLAVGSVLLLLLALTIYQPAAMFFWVFATIVLFKLDASLPCVLRRFLWYSAIAFAGLLLGFVVYKLGISIYGKDILSPARSHLTQDILRKMSWFFREPLMNALNLIKLFPSPWLALSVAVFIAGGLREYFHGEAKERLLKCMIALSVIPLSYLPNLVVAENWSSYRTQSALTSIIVVYAFFALWGYGQILRRPVTALVLTAGLGFAALASGLLAAYNVSTYFASPQLLELKLMRSQLVQKDLSPVHSIYVIGCKWQDSIAPAVRYDEFGLPSSAQPRAPGPAVYLLLREMNPEQANIPIEVSSADGPISPPPDALVVDTRKLLSFR